MLFGNTAQGNCVGCHSGTKWTISNRFYTPGDTPNAASGSTASTSLSMVSWDVNLNGFPSSLLPSTVSNRFMRFGAPPGAEQLQCTLRPVGTFSVSDSAINVLELRQDMATTAQGNASTGNGFNTPSLLGSQIGGPFFHAGNARTLEELFTSRFSGHYQSAVAQVFSPDATQLRQLVAFLLSIDESTTAFLIPAKSNTGGVLCFYP
jgi:cytochrome c peroxidase